MEKPSKYVPALDGLRTLAVVSVIIYHSNAKWLPGGLLGVTIFFVLSGYLITGLLVTELQKEGSIRLGRFWSHRVRRLVPAILLLLSVVLILSAILRPQLYGRMRPDILPALFFYSNWWDIFQDLSYFEAAASPSPLNHFWSLGIEEQFYIIWPLLLLLLFKVRTPRKAMLLFIGILILLSAGDMALLYEPGGDPSRVYYGTDTRAFSLLIGALFAFLFPSARLRTSRRAPAYSASTRVPMEILGYVSLAFLIACMVLLDGYSKWWYYGGIFLASLATACLMIALVNPRTSLGRIFALRPFVWLGERSYGLYLWHYPLLLLMNPLNRTAPLPLWAYPLQWALIVVVAALSYHFVENPIRRGCLGRYFQQWRDQTVSLGRLVSSHIFYVILTPVLIGAAILVYVLVPPPATLEEEAAYQQTAQGGSGYQGGTLNPEETVYNDPRTWKMILVGDSVSLGAQEWFLDTFTNSFQDSQINRRMVDAPEAYAPYADQDWDAVIFALGTNTVAPDDAAENMVACVGSTTTPILLVNVRNPYPLTDMNNALIDAVVAKYDNVFLVDWYGLSADHPEYIGEDGTHLTAEGAQAYVDLILATLQGLD